MKLTAHAACDRMSAYNEVVFVSQKLQLYVDSLQSGFCFHFYKGEFILNRTEAILNLANKCDSFYLYDETNIQENVSRLQSHNETLCTKNQHIFAG